MMIDEIPYENALRRDPSLALRESGHYFAGEGALLQTLRDLAQRLEAAGIPYAVVGSIAMAHHGYVRMTEDLDVLLTVEGLEAFKKLCVGRGYLPAFPGARKAFRSTETKVRVEFLTTGQYPGDGLPKPVQFPDPADTAVKIGGIRVIALDRLIELKLASGASAPHRLRDLADVQDLIRVLQLDEAFAGRLDASVRALYRQLWQAAQAGKENIEIGD